VTKFFTHSEKGRRLFSHRQQQEKTWRSLGEGGENSEKERKLGENKEKERKLPAAHLLICHKRVCVLLEICANHVGLKI